MNSEYESVASRRYRWTSPVGLGIIACLGALLQIVVAMLVLAVGTGFPDWMAMPLSLSMIGGWAIFAVFGLLAFWRAD